MQFFTRLLVRNYESDVIDAVRNLYTRRSRGALPMTRIVTCSRSARLDAVRASPTYKRNAIGIPRLPARRRVVSPARPDGALSFDWALATRVAVIVTSLAARHRPAVRGLGDPEGAGRRSTSHPAHHRAAAGHPLADDRRCGKPPEDQARQFAVIALVVMLVGALVIPAAIAFVARF